ncbi:MAG: HAMP domain-containing histidine kinase [Anaerolineae bacterium]|nr:HAMP domain-containing histidine kinase [Anaerolineae bacterium]
MRVLKLHASLRYALSSAVFAGLWVLESRARERAESRLEQQVKVLDSERAALVAENVRLIELDQLKSKFIADAAHELRTPITSLNLRLYMLEHATPERRPHYLSEFQQQLARLSNLTEDLLTIARLDSFDPATDFEPVDLNLIAEEIMIAYRPLAEASGLSLITQYTPNLPPVPGDHRRLVQVGSNLVANAIHYTPSGHVVISTALDIPQKRVYLEVQDTGIGIPATDLPHLFERFYRGQLVHHTDIPGTGLGLSIVKEIVDLHGGTIEVQSTEGEGSIFRICFPVDAVASSQAAD